MTRLDLFAYKIKSSDSDAFVEEAVAYSKNALVFVYDFDKITLAYAGPQVTWEQREIPFVKTKSHRLNHYLSPFLLFFQLVTYARVFWRVCSKYKPRVCWIENAFACFVIGLMRPICAVEKLIYLPGDWLVSARNQRFFSFVANNMLFPLVDYADCRLSDLVLDHTRQITEARDSYWKRRVPKEQGWYAYKPELNVSISKDRGMRKNICFIGQMRAECGLDLAIEALQRIRDAADISLVVIGPKTMAYRHFKALAEKSGVADHVRFMGYVDNDGLFEAMKGSFCGLNILTVRDSYSSYTMPGKIMHYIQHLLPVIVTEGVGAFAQTVRDHGVGMVIEPTADDFVVAVLDIYRNQQVFRDRIVSYVASLPTIRLKDYVENKGAAHAR